jgi:methyl-accepting chemotaxis protein
MQKRRRYFLPDTEQSGLLRALFLIWLLTTVAAGLIIYIGASRAIEAETYRAHVQALRQTGQIFLPFLLVGNLVAAIAVLVLGIFYTHRVAGPIYQIEQRLARLRDGDFQISFKIRQADRFHSLNDALNGVAEAIRIRMEKGRTAAAALGTAWERTGVRSEEWDRAMRELNDALGERKT